MEHILHALYKPTKTETVSQAVPMPSCYHQDLQCRYSLSIEKMVDQDEQEELLLYSMLSRVVIYILKSSISSS